MRNREWLNSPLCADLDTDAAVDAGASVNIDQTIWSAPQRGAFEPGGAVATGNADTGGRHADGAPWALRLANAAGGALAGVDLVAARDQRDGGAGAYMETDVAVRADTTVKAALTGLSACGLAAQTEIDLFEVPD